MFTKPFILEQHIEELRAELRGSADVQEAAAIRAELDLLLTETRDDESRAEA